MHNLVIGAFIPAVVLLAAGLLEFLWHRVRSKQNRALVSHRSRPEANRGSESVAR
jgi:hypothetical protein